MVANSVVIVDLEDKHIEYIADNLQELDKVEVEDNLSAPTIKEHLINARKQCEYNKAVLSKGEICAMIGYKTLDFSPIGCKVGAMYTLTTKNLVNNKFGYLKTAQRFVSEMLKTHDVLYFLVLHNYKASIKALEILGFKPFRALKLKDNWYVEMLLFKDKKIWEI